MGKVFELDFRKGSLVERYNGYTPISPCAIERTERGKAISSLRSQRALVYSAGGKVPFGVDSWSIEFWAINKDLQDTRWYFGQGGSGVQGVQVYSNGNNVVCSIQGVTGGASNSFYGGYNRFKWHHIVVTCDRVNNLLTIYLDGRSGVPVSISSVVGTLTRTNSNTGFMTYSAVSSGDTMTGNMALFRLYNHVLSSKEIEGGYKEFWRSKPTERPISNFTYPKPTDLSFEKDSKLNLIPIPKITPAGWGSATWVIGNESATISSLSGDLFTLGFFILPLTKYRYDIVVSIASGSLGIIDYNGVIMATLTNGRNVGTFTTTSYIYQNKPFYIRAGSNTIATVYTPVIFQVTGLIAAYSFSPQTIDKGTLIDISGSRNNGIISGPLLTNNGIKYNKIIDTITSTSDIILNANLTICIRFYLKSYGFGSGQVGMLFNDSKNIIYTYSAGTSIRFSRNGAGPESVDAIPLETWIDYCITSTASGVTKTYINGILKTEFTATISAGTTSWTIGNNTAKTWGIDGILADFKIYNRILSLKEVQDYHNSFIKPVLLEDFSNYSVGDTL